MEKTTPPISPQPFQTAMVESPPPWRLKILGVAAEKRLKNSSAQEAVMAEE